MNYIQWVQRWSQELGKGTWTEFKKTDFFCPCMFFTLEYTGKDFLLDSLVSKTLDSQNLRVPVPLGKAKGQASTFAPTSVNDAYTNQRKIVR